MNDRPTTARRVVVRGLVQGVFFRDTCRREAMGHDVVGWVSNEPDGTVHAHFEGPPSPRPPTWSGGPTRGRATRSWSGSR